ncbi:MAG: hypothetical protein WC682_00815 [Parcubacteria group bacterium]|jgi:hypothetical protein
MESKKNNHDYNFFVCLSLFVVAIGWGLFLLTLLGIFYWWSISLLIAIITAGGARFILFNLTRLSSSFLIINILLILTAIFFTFFSSPTIFTGRDQGSISQASIYLSKTGNLKFSTSVSEDFFKINNIQKDKLKNCLIDNLDDFKVDNSLKSKFYQVFCKAKTSSKAFNFPGFYYTSDGKLITQFPIVYISWLALFYSFLGIIGFKVANAILIYLSFLVLYLIFHKLTNLIRASAKTKILTQISGLIILLTSFCFMWFSKFTLTENIALPLLWSGIFALLLLTESKTQSPKYQKALLILLFSSLGLLVFTRIEGIVFFSLALVFLLINSNTGRYYRKSFLKIILLPIIFIGIIFVWNLNVDIYFYKSILKATLENISENSSDVVKNNSLLLIFNLFKIFGLYGILMPILFGLAGIFYLAKKKKYQILTPLFIVFPSFFYIISPQITIEHPWMLRRFTFSILPLFIIYSLFLINSLYAKKRVIPGIIITLIIVAFNLPSFTKYLTFVPNKELLEGTRQINQNFSAQDLILVDQTASGNNFEMIADTLGSIFNKNAVYFFNPQDLAKIDKEKYNKVFLITPQSNIDYYKKTVLGENMLFIKEYSLSSDVLTSDNSYTLPQKETRVVNGSIFEIIK